MDAFVERMLEEEKDLHKKLDDLNRFAAAPAFIGLSPLEQFMLLTQRDSMEMYHNVLRARIKFYQQRPENAV